MWPSEQDLVALEDKAAAELDAAGAAALATIREGVLGSVTDLDLEYVALSLEEGFVENAGIVLSVVAARARAVQTAEVPFISDKAFTPEEAQVAERALRVGLVLDASWVPVTLSALADVAVAPTTAKSLPSQAMCFALARAIRDCPTPEAVSVLSDVARTVRHAGVKKKLNRYTSAARRGLAARPHVALRVPVDGTMTKTQVAAWSRTLEACWLHDASWPARQWAAVVHGRPETSGPASRLVWVADGIGSFRGSLNEFVTADDERFVLPDDVTVRLWHPVCADTAERRAWRDHVYRHRIDQPIRQAFREYYTAGDLSVEGLVVDAKQLVGIARKEGWQIGYHALERRVGPLKAEIPTDDNVYPGYVGDVVLGTVTVGQAVRTGQRYQTWRIEPVEDDEFESVAVSEVLRSADLLASTSAIALDDHLTWLHHSAQTPGGVLATRRTALKHVLAELSDSASIKVGRRHVAVGIHQIHLATGRVTYKGEPVTIEPVTNHQLWTPPDPLLNRIVGLVVALLDESRTP